MANYILWGRKQGSDKNVVQDKEIQIQTRAGLWESNSSQVESLDNLLAQPNFSENSIIAPNAPKWKYPKEKLSREKIRKELGESDELVLFEDLWRRIDTLDLELNYYDLAHGKRTKPPREELIVRFTEEEQSKLRESAQKLNQFKYLKKRHLLVELRREQFTLRDTYIANIVPHERAPQTITTPLNLETDIICAPCGLRYEGVQLWEKVFPKDRFPCPSDFSQKELEVLMKFYWTRAKEI
jgi:hypothetical protein